VLSSGSPDGHPFALAPHQLIADRLGEGDESLGGGADPTRDGLADQRRVGVDDLELLLSGKHLAGFRWWADGSGVRVRRSRAVGRRLGTSRVHAIDVTTGLCR
jgi:hypothetical protein